MSRVIDLTGMRFGRLTVLERQGSNNRGQALWGCVCDCGNEVVVESWSLRGGNTQSCGCLWKERVRETIQTHGMSRTSIYHTWESIRKRCGSKKHKNFKDYGGRGISVCSEWIDDFQSFYDYVSQLPHFGEPGRELDRIDNDKNYEPGNVRWSTRKEQCNNRRSNLLVTYNGKTQTVTQWAEEVGIPYHTIRERLMRGWSAEKALTTPLPEKRGKTK